MTFDEWFEESGLTESEAALMCGVSRSYVARLRRGARPSDLIKIQIEVGTSGQVRYEDWKPKFHADEIKKSIALRPSQSKLESGAHT